MPSPCPTPLPQINPPRAPGPYTSLAFEGGRLLFRPEPPARDALGLASSAAAGESPRSAAAGAGAVVTDSEAAAAVGASEEEGSSGGDGGGDGEG